MLVAKSPECPVQSVPKKWSRANKSRSYSPPMRCRSLLGAQQNTKKQIPRVPGKIHAFIFFNVWAANSCIVTPPVHFQPQPSCEGVYLCYQGSTINATALGSTLSTIGCQRRSVFCQTMGNRFVPRGTKSKWAVPPFSTTRCQPPSYAACRQQPRRQLIG